MKQVQGWWSPDLSPHLEIFTPAGATLDMIVDSGFNGELTLPAPLIAKLGLKRRGIRDNLLADGSIMSAKTYTGEILWFGVKRRVLVQATDSDEGLLGTQLFQGCKVELDPDADLVVFTKKSAKAKRGSTQ
jgi:clan AA aspartic protease